MLLKIACTCGHVGVVDASTLPRSLVCSSCGSSRRIDSSDGKAITSTARFEEYLAGERGRPQVRRKAASLFEPLGSLVARRSGAAITLPPGRRERTGGHA